MKISKLGATLSSLYLLGAIGILAYASVCEGMCPLIALLVYSPWIKFSGFREFIWNDIQNFPMDLFDISFIPIILNIALWYVIGFFLGKLFQSIKMRWGFYGSLFGLFLSVISYFSIESEILGGKFAIISLIIASILTLPLGLLALFTLLGDLIVVLGKLYSLCLLLILNWALIGMMLGKLSKSNIRKKSKVIIIIITIGLFLIGGFYIFNHIASSIG